MWTIVMRMSAPLRCSLNSYGYSSPELTVQYGTIYRDPVRHYMRGWAQFLKVWSPSLTATCFAGMLNSADQYSIPKTVILTYCGFPSMKELTCSLILYRRQLSEQNIKLLVIRGSTRAHIRSEGIVDPLSCDVVAIYHICINSCDCDFEEVVMRQTYIHCYD